MIKLNVISKSKEKRRVERNDPEIQVRHRDVAERLRNNYSIKSKGSMTQLASSKPSETSSSILSENTTPGHSFAKKSKYNLLKCLIIKY